MATANKLTDMEVSSVDLCKKGANQRSQIKLFKSAPERGAEHGMNVTITKAAGTAQVRETTSALRKSLESIIADDSLSSIEKHNMMEESLLQFAAEATDLMDDWAVAIGKAEPEEDPEEDDTENVESPAENPEEEPAEEPEEEPMEKTKGASRGSCRKSATINIDKMSPEDQATLAALEKKYSGADYAEPAARQIHPEVQKAIDEVAVLRKSLELKEMADVAKKYDVIGKKADELAPKLYDLKKAGDQYYQDYIALLDEQVQLAQSGIFKEYGTSRAATDLNATVGEVLKANPNMTRAQAVVKAFEMNPNLDPFTGRVR